MDLQIGICDDSSIDLDLMKKSLTKILDASGVSYRIHSYESGNELVKNISKVSSFDVLLLDIDMPGIDGIDVARRLADGSSLVNIIFITNHNELVFEAIHYRPFRFIRKEKLQEELEEAVLAVITKISEETLLYEFGAGRDNVKIRLLDVDYLESKGHYIQIHSGGEVTEIRGKISQYEEKLKNYGFIRIHLGYLVNVRKIYNISSKGVKLDNMELLPISRKNIEGIKETHANYVRRFVRGIN